MNGDVGHTDPEPPSLPRKISLQRGSDGYGFNLHGEKGIHGQFISAVDEGSPARLNDVRVGDRVIAVNGEDVEDLSHSKVVERIRAGGNEVTLLLVDEECDRFYKDRGIKIPQDKFETVSNSNAVPDMVDHEFSNVHQETEEQNGELVETDTKASNESEGEKQEEKAIQEAEEETEDGNEYEEVVPQVSNKPVEKPPEPVTEKPAEEVDALPKVWEQQESDPTAEQTTTTTTITTTADTNTVKETPSVDESSPKLDMAAARPKPRRNEVKRATQNWKQKYDDFNKL